MKRLLSSLLALTMVFSMTTSVFAIDTAGGTGDVPVELTQAVSAFSVTVPTVLPVDVSADGEITVATDNKIINNSWGPVEVKGVEVQPIDPWTLVDFETDFTQKKVGLSEFGFQLNNSNVEIDGGCAAEFEVIEGNSEIAFTYDANVAAQKQALEDVQIAQVVFTMGWYKDDIITIQSGQAGLYDSNGIMICSWEESGIDAEIDYGLTNNKANPYQKTPTSAYYVLKNNYPTATQIIVPDNITKIGRYSFYQCGKITAIVIPTSITEIGESALHMCTSLKNIYYKGSKDQFYSISFGANWNSYAGGNVGGCEIIYDYQG